MGHSPKEKPKLTEIQSKQTMQWNLHHPDDYGEFSHLLISTSWWSSQKEKTTQQNIQQTKRYARVENSWSYYYKKFPQSKMH